MIALVVYAAAVLLPFVVSIPIFILWLVGMLFAPIAALSCAAKARGKGLSAKRFALAGAAASLLFFLPWIYLILRMSDRSVPTRLVRLFYIAILALWILGPIGSGVILGAMGLFSALPPSGKYDALPSALVALVVTAANLFLWWRAKRAVPDASVISESAEDGILPARRYAIPLVYTYMSFWVTFVILQATSPITN